MTGTLTDRVWVRSHEEEKGPVRIYRPQGYPFPPARGREGLSFNSDGAFEYITPGRGDQPVGVPGRWHGDPGDPARISAEADGVKIELKIIEVTDDMLRLEWLNC
jgi:hypothetical protein